MLLSFHVIPQMNQKSGGSISQHHQVTKYTKQPPKCVTSCFKRGMFGHMRVNLSLLHASVPLSCARDIIQGATLIILGLQCVGHNIHPMGLHAPMKF
jgi:hypothetical protein